jgi:Transmembrane secretion effector
MQRARERWSADRVATLGVAIFGLVTIATGAGRGFPVLGILMLLGGASWTSFLSLFNVQLLNQAPDWVRARVLAVSMLVFQGAVAGGSAVWGSAAKRVGVDKALLLAGIGAIATTGLGLFLRFPEGAIDLTPWNHWRTPASPGESDLERPVLVTVEYEVEPGSMITGAFDAATGRRDGACAGTWRHQTVISKPSSLVPGRSICVSMIV